MTTVIAPPEPDLLMLLNQASYALQTELTAALEGLGISPRMHCVLCHAAPGNLTQGQLAEACALDKTTMVVTVDELERAGLARRERCPNDRRACFVVVTPAGREMLARTGAIVNAMFADVLGALPEGERATFLSALRRLVEGRLSTPAHTERPVRRRAQRAAS
ncbi:MAG: MarR family winged helix-turn-helix transcriptional regulator [Mycobacteriales bacterium]|jgi:MarR family transcriptional regulator, transcriptional regulator for hemolysin